MVKSTAKNRKKKILVMRFSAMGDVAMTVPVVYSLAKQYPDVEFTVASRKFFEPFYAPNPQIKFIGIDFKADEYKGFLGIFKLFRRLKAEKFDMVADLHRVLRTIIICWLFKLTGTPVRHIHKGRKARKQLTRRHDKKFRKLPAVTQRYAKVFASLGYPVHFDFKSIFDWYKLKPDEKGTVTGVKDCKWLGVAPFAKHKGKIYPIDKMEEVVAYFAERPDVKVFLFGAGKEERAILERWEAMYTDAISMVGKLDLSGELDVINRLDVMLAMDSANMHLASIVDTPVVSVWGATHPIAGFYGWHQSPENAIQVENLSCRPCSIFGNKECYRGDYACFAGITPQMIIDKLRQFLG